MLKDFFNEILTVYKEISKYLKFIVAILLFLLSSLFKLIPVYLFNLDINNISTKTNCYLTLFSNVVLLIILVILYFNDIKKAFIDIKNSKKDKIMNNLDTTLRYWIIGLLIMIVSNFFIGMLGISESSNDSSIQLMLEASPIVSCISVLVIAPFIEEITFRLAFKKIFNNKWLFILLSGIIFGSMHVIFSISYWYDLLYLIPYCALGLSFSFIYYETDNVLYTYLVHFLHNAITAFTTFLLMGMIIC